MEWLNILFVVFMIAMIAAGEYYIRKEKENDVEK